MLRGVGELHLEIVCDKLKRMYGVQVETGKTYVAYREGIAGPVSVHVEYDRAATGRRMFAAVRLRLEPTH
eukprot:18176-Eustigmatos_ZCMA.PRE.1